MFVPRVYWIKLLCVLLISGCVSHVCGAQQSSALTQNSWPQIYVQQQTAMRSQRDLMRNVTVDQIPYVGVNLGKVLFNNASDIENSYYNTPQSLNGSVLLDTFSSLLNSGVQSFVLDVELGVNSWIIKDTPLSLQAFLQTLETFIVQSHDDLSANILLLLINFETGPNNGTLWKNWMASTHDSNMNLTYVFDKYIGSHFIYAPADLRKDQVTMINDTVTNNSSVQWPTVQNFLFDKRKRLIVTELTNILNYTDSSYIFPPGTFHYDSTNSSLSCPSSVEEIEETAAVSWRFLDAPFTPDDIEQYIGCGLNPLIANDYNITSITNVVDLLHHSLIWTWGDGEPRLSNSRLLMGKDSMQAYNCALIRYTAENQSISWAVGNCFNSKLGLCRSEEDQYLWDVADDRESYFDYENFKDPLCRPGYNFSLPQTPLEERSLLLHLSNVTDNLELWVNLNSISVSNCWVVGGLYAMCPYENAVSKRSFVASLVPVVAVSACLLLVVLYLTVVSVPIHDNRKNWRRVVNQISKSEFEGVPS
ncbi:Mtc6p KNAG_0E00540 [Huiozyma naganishii CBS 8797]|uniref:Maintenance of telomere capping protein 6 n=1 Tax=Huiozyma naganishii (strain ATCC MYA-139 / BCRC 22969 / CBS 8797 / KCTC 17520 / NBRC 10181 / NCYC 3082 / Yp74L-3) TaxID=1071383 RepID=J7RYR8_HUIN7|nr:hypothetical protein KNAG_0E00540 [Kazachstania naganishii CBS 8797]CCK70322.1 hypothetical protein KNAG_0E00540 [Kazachstania naganishii CBS 8797]